MNVASIRAYFCVFLMPSWYDNLLNKYTILHSIALTRAFLAISHCKVLSYGSLSYLYAWKKGDMCTFALSSSMKPHMAFMLCLHACLLRNGIAGCHKTNAKSCTLVKNQ